MGSLLRVFIVIGVFGCMLSQPIFAAAARTDARVDVVSPVMICGLLDEECARLGVRMSATSPELITRPDTVAKLDIVGGKDRGCAIVLPQNLEIHDSSGRKIATCILSSTMGKSTADSTVVGVVIKAKVLTSEPGTAHCRADFEVVVAYD